MFDCFRSGHSDNKKKTKWYLMCSMPNEIEWKKGEKNKLNDTKRFWMIRNSDRAGQW